MVVTGIQKDSTTHADVTLPSYLEEGYATFIGDENTAPDVTSSSGMFQGKEELKGVLMARLGYIPRNTFKGCTNLEYA